MRQKSRIKFLAKGDANMKFFHLQACHRDRKNFIKHLCHQGIVVVDERDKDELVFQHFNTILGSYEPRSHGLNYGHMGMPTIDMATLDSYFTEDEVWSVIKTLPPNKVSGPDLFTW
jgi:hypothetical protein